MSCGLEIKPGSKIELRIEGDVSFKGGINCDGIRVHPTSEILITGNGNLYCSGNNEHERYHAGKSDKFTGLAELYYGDVGYDDATGTRTADYETYKKPDSNAGHATAGSGIGYAQNDGVGKITIDGLAHVTAKGYGRNAFGIGGGDGTVVTIKNTTIDYARGGYGTVRKKGEVELSDIPSKDFISERRCYSRSAFGEDAGINGTDFGICLEYGKTEAEGGCAIGVGAGIDGDTDSGTLIMENVTVLRADGGSKAAAIGGLWWCAPDIRIKNCDLHNVTGGNASAAIGGSRAQSDPNSNINLVIEDSTLDNIVGGTYAAAIGSGYNNETTAYGVTPECNIEIKGYTVLSNITGGINAPAIGAGYHQSKLTGYIAPEVTRTNVKAGKSFGDFDQLTLDAGVKSSYFKKGSEGKNDSGKYLYADNQYGTLSKPQDIGYGVLYTHGVNRECTNNKDGDFSGFEGVFNNSEGFKIAGSQIDNPRSRENNLSRNSGDCPTDPDWQS
jgi:hypothetical protein